MFRNKFGLRTSKIVMHTTFRIVAHPLSAIAPMTNGAGFLPPDSVAGRVVASNFERTHNMSRRLKSVMLAMALCSWNISPAESKQQDLPILGDMTSGIISLEQERVLGQDFLRSLRSQVPTVADALLKDYIEFLIYDLAAHSKLNDRRLELVIIDSKELNAFAAPGGIVGVNLGLFLYGETENEVSAILAHELAHLSQRHFARQVETNRKAGLASMAGLLAGIILIATTGADAGIAALTASQGIAQQTALRFSRAREAEADRFGIYTLADSDRDPRAMAHIFERLSKLNRYSGQRIPEFMLTHPVTRSRIADAYNHTRAYPKKDYPLKLDYQLMRARVQVMTEDSPEVAVQRMRDGLKDLDETKRFASRYGLVLALTKAGRHSQAQSNLDVLIEQRPNKISLLLCQADIHVATKKYQLALDILKEQLAINPDNYPITIQYAETLIQSNQPQAAEALLEQQTISRSSDADIWYILAETYGLTNNIPGVHQARAQWYVLNGNLDQAVKQLQYALPLVTDSFQETARITQRLQDIDTLRERKL